MFQARISAGLALSLTVTSATAVDINSMSAAQKRIHCVAYGLIDAQIMLDNGQLNEREYDYMRNQLVWKIQNKGDNYNYSQDFRRLNRAIETIIAEDPTVGEIQSTAKGCRSYLRL